MSNKKNIEPLVGEELLQKVKDLGSASKEEKALTTDGPFAETKEQLGGYYLIEVANLDAAIKWAAKIPSAAFGSVEIRPQTENQA